MFIAAGVSNKLMINLLSFNLSIYLQYPADSNKTLADSEYRKHFHCSPAVDIPSQQYYWKIWKPTICMH